MMKNFTNLPAAGAKHILRSPLFTSSTSLLCLLDILVRPHVRALCCHLTAILFLNFVLLRIHFLNIQRVIWATIACISSGAIQTKAVNCNQSVKLNSEPLIHSFVPTRMFTRYVFINYTCCVLNISLIIVKYLV